MKKISVAVLTWAAKFTQTIEGVMANSVTIITRRENSN
jgi:hypothetical protein